MRRSFLTGTIAENLLGTQTSFQWQVGKTLTGSVNPGSDYKVRVTAMVPPVASGTTYYFYDSGGKLLSEYDGTGACVKDYLYLGGKMIGEYVPTTSSYYYYASDQINSIRMVTDATGAIVHSAQYDPYGGMYKTWVDTYHPKPGFSGKEREFGSEMDYFGARYYGHRQYRFISTDPVINMDGTITDPQLWNLYIYCQNNPINYTDQNGMEPEHFRVKYSIQLVGLGQSFAFKNLNLNFLWGQTCIDPIIAKSLNFKTINVNGKIQIEATLFATIKILNPFDYSVLWLIGGEKPRDTLIHELGHINDLEIFGDKKIGELENLIDWGQIENNDITILNYIKKIVEKANRESVSKRDSPISNQNTQEEMKNDKKKE